MLHFSHMLVLIAHRYNPSKQHPQSDIQMRALAVSSPDGSWWPLNVVHSSCSINVSDERSFVERRVRRHGHVSDWDTVALGREDLAI